MQPKKNKGGRPKGRKNDRTLHKERELEALRQLVMESIKPMATAQIANAQGVKYLIARDKRTGKFIPLTEEAARIKLAGQENENEIIELWEDKPNVQAFDSLLNRTFGKPAETTEVIHSGEVRVYAWEK